MRTPKEKQRKRELIEILERRNKIRIMGFPTKTGKIEKRKCEILGYTIQQQTNAPHKYFVLDLMLLHWKQERTRKKELRIGYYILGKKKTVFNKWMWGQYAPLIPPRDLRNLLRKAKNKGLF